MAGELVTNGLRRKKLQTRIRRKEAAGEEETAGERIEKKKKDWHQEIMESHPGV